MPAGVLITTPNIRIRGHEPQHGDASTAPSRARRRCSRRRPQPRTSGRAAREEAARAERRHGLEGGQRLGPEPHRLQLPQRHRTTPGNEIWWNGGDGSGKIGGWGFHGSYLTATSTFFKVEKTAAAVRDLLEQLERRHLGPRRTPATSTTRASTSAPASSSATRRSTTRGREFNALGYSGSNSGGSLVVKNSEFDHNEDGLRHQQPERRQPAAAERRVPAQRDQPDHAYALLLGVHAQLRARQQQPERAERRARPQPARSEPGMSISGGRNDTIMHNRFVHNDAWGADHRAVPGQRQAVHRRHANRRCSARAAACSTSGATRCSTTRSPPTAASGTRPTATSSSSDLEQHPSDCFSGNTDTRGHPHADVGGARADLPDLHDDAGAAEPQRPVPQRGRCATRRSAPAVRLPAWRPLSAPHAASSCTRCRRNLKTMPNPCAGVPRTRGARRTSREDERCSWRGAAAAARRAGRRNLCGDGLPGGQARIEHRRRRARRACAPTCSARVCDQLDELHRAGRAPSSSPAARSRGAWA